MSLYPLAAVDALHQQAVFHHTFVLLHAVVLFLQYSTPAFHFLECF